MSIFLKDDKLASIKDNGMGNIAQFISVDPDYNVKHVYINDYKKKNNKCDIKDLVVKLLQQSRSHAVNIRSFSKLVMKGNSLVYNKTINDIDEIVNTIIINSKEGKYSIINENIDVMDGGVSGVVLGNLIEFAPQDTPKCVDKENVCHIEKNMGFYILEKVYGFKPVINFKENYRVEFSIHPNEEGIEKSHTIIWEYEEFESELIVDIPNIKWPNKFSQFIGDKVFGLLVADYFGFKVPYTTVIAREVAPFTFGTHTGSIEKWIRTAPIKKVSGRFYTGKNWKDPFLLMENEEKIDKDGLSIASILSQDSVKAEYSGAAIISSEKEKIIIEGVKGSGDNFMIGEDYSTNLPDYVLVKLNEVIDNFRKLKKQLGEVSIEWVYDGVDIWVVQLNQLNISGFGNVIVQGNPEKYIEVPVLKGLDYLRTVIEEVRDTNNGILLLGDVGITSHFGDLLRIAKIPSKIKRFNTIK